ncbi:MAG: hypothetical protein JWP02_2190 [Acidimicrobiales bacterium]|nr:hypothetical protein [Acidimicrobiales bacterium]
MWQIACPETGWRSSLYSDRAAAERKARSIDMKIARVNGLSPHRHRVVEVDVHPVNDVTPAARLSP